MRSDGKPSASALASLAEMAEVRNRCVDAGICIGCRIRLSSRNRLHCALCIARRAKEYRARTRHRARKYRCTICRRLGHNRATCQSPKAANYWSEEA